MDSNSVRHVVVVGGGSAGWMTAAALVRHLGADCKIRLVESDEIGIVGVGEATVPHIRTFNQQALGLDEAEFIRATQGTFKLGIEFRDWARIGDRYMHGFGTVGHDPGPAAFHHYWLRLLRSGKQVGDIGSYQLQTLASREDRFLPGASDVPPTSPLANVAYAYHFDATLYARYLRGFAERLGVERIEGKVVDVELRAEDGFVTSIVMADGRRLEGDLFIDCSGFRGLLIEQALNTGYEDWSHWLPCDRAMAVPCERVGDPAPYTRSTARVAGWQWRIPLQHRTGNGMVYCGRFLGDDEAAATLLANLDGPALAEPRPLRFVTGKRKRFWNRNVVAIGLASGFMEPLESTSLLMIQTGILRLLDMFPGRDMQPSLVARYNERTHFEYDHIRDFLILHYKAVERNEPFWRECREMVIPDSLQANMDLFRNSGRFYRDGEEFFALQSWVQVMLGQRVVPSAYSPLVDRLSEAEVEAFVTNVGRTIERCVQAMPKHQAFIDRYCRAPAP